MRSDEDRYNYIRKLNALVAAGLLPLPHDKGRPPIVHLHIHHDDDCPILRGKKRCSCDPEIRLNGQLLELPLDS